MSEILRRQIEKITPLTDQEFSIFCLIFEKI